LLAFIIKFVPRFAKVAVIIKSYFHHIIIKFLSKLSAKVAIIIKMD